LSRSCLVSPRGRRVFVDAAARLARDIEYDAYIMEQAALRLESKTDWRPGHSRWN
jgi:hypothetical protein